MERPAVTCYKDVLKLCPFALDAAQALMALGTKPKEVQELTLEATEGKKKIVANIYLFSIFVVQTYMCDLTQLSIKSQPLRNFNCLGTCIIMRHGGAYSYLHEHKHIA